MDELQELFNLMSDEHDKTLLQAEMLEIVEVCRKYLIANTEPVAEVPCSGVLSGALDTGDLVNDPLYKTLDKLYERGWIDKHKEQDYDPRGTTEWQSVLDLFRLQKAR